MAPAKYHRADFINSHLIGHRIRKGRLDKGLTQLQLSETICRNMNSKEKISKLTISAYENGRRIPSVTALVAICLTLDLSIDYVLGIGNYRSSSQSEQESEDTPLPKPDVAIIRKDYEYYHNYPVYMKSSHSQEYDGIWGIMDFYGGCIKTAKGEIPLSLDLKLYRMLPIEDEYPAMREHHPITIGTLMDMQKVWVESKVSNDSIRTAYTGYYRHAENKMCLVNISNGLTLPYEGLGISYNAFNVNM